MWFFLAPKRVLYLLHTPHQKLHILYLVRQSTHSVMLHSKITLAFLKPSTEALQHAINSSAVCSHLSHVVIKWTLKFISEEVLAHNSTDKNCSAVIPGPLDVRCVSELIQQIDNMGMLKCFIHSGLCNWCTAGVNIQCINRKQTMSREMTASFVVTVSFHFQWFFAMLAG